MRITSKGQVTIPAHIREQAGLLPHTEVEFVWDGNSVQIVKSAESHKISRGQALISHLQRHRGEAKLSTDEIMAMMRGDEA